MEWWNIFWDIYQARSKKDASPSARLYMERQSENAKMRYKPAYGGDKLPMDPVLFILSCLFASSFSHF